MKGLPMSPSIERVLPPPSLWQEGGLSREPADMHLSEPGAASDPGERATRGAPGRGTRTRLAITRIDPDPRNPRAPSAQEIRDLAASLTAHGMLQPIVVRPAGQRYVVVAGHRRLAAWRHCASQSPSDPRWRTIDVVVAHDVGAEEALTLMLVENLQRKSLSPLQEAVTLQRLRVERGWTNRQVAEAVGRSEMYVSRRLRVLDDAALRDAVLDGRLPVTTAEELLAADAASRGPLVQRAIAETWSPNHARRAVQELGPSRGGSAEERWRAPLLALLQLLDKQAAPPPTLRTEIVRVAERLLAHYQA
jgi:ParB family transcriptional regulator, chromosome partitioning protein